MRSALGVALALTALPGARVEAQALSLADAARAALESHPSVASAEARLGAAHASGSVARAAWLPGASVSATLTRFQEPMVVAPLHSLDLTNPPRFDPTLVQGQLAAQYTLYDGTRSPRIEGADAMIGASEADLHDARMIVLEETAAAFLGVLSGRTVLEAAAAHVEALESERLRADQQLSAGTVPELDVLRAAATLQEARAEEATARARLGAAERALARWMGVDPARVTGRPLRDLGVSAEARRGDALAGPAIARAAGHMAAAEARLAEERGLRLPTLRAGAGLLDFGTVSGRHVTEWQAGLQVSWPLFTGGARSAAVRRAAAEVSAAEGSLATARLAAAQAVDAAEAAVLEAEARGEALASAVTQWEEVARIEALALASGAGVQTDLLRAEAGLFRARAGEAQARYDAILARVRLARTEGVLDQDWLSEALEERP